MAEVSFFGTARVLPTYYSNFDFNDNLPDAQTSNEAGLTMGEHVRAELRLGWKAGGDKWKIFFIAESDLIMEKDTADRSFTPLRVRGNIPPGTAALEHPTPAASSIERVELTYSFTPAFVLATGWNIRAADIQDRRPPVR
jgi:hypothetical protein